MPPRLVAWVWCVCSVLFYLLGTRVEVHQNEWTVSADSRPHVLATQRVSSNSSLTNLASGLRSEHYSLSRSALAEPGQNNYRPSGAPDMHGAQAYIMRAIHLACLGPESQFFLVRTLHATVWDHTTETWISSIH